MAQDRIVEMPDVYQRFVCQQVAATFHPFAAHPMSASSVNLDQSLMNEGTIPVESAAPPGTMIPPMPPASADPLNP
jgi:hypothetical protein